ncbi:hypothetical protein MIND_00418600 [Mycena indigotica]|uniref:Uncharacterized protein n=1 Tax=Mycena indigotica TaxID=2126181 RepID=A0A8H6SWU1_9AGAR|nr:uncharacterized protein MIND_00418600 [Mycena indigotica]KAF7306277.1 hypothetical protein MIND_00418600 [Mycena indigotica]
MTLLSSNSTLVELWFHGLYSAIVIVTLGLIYHHRGTKKIFQATIVAIPWTCSTIHATLTWWWLANAIDTNEGPNGPGLAFSLSHLPPDLAVVAQTFFALNIFLADCMFIWRCWCVWNRRSIVVLLPVIAAIIGAVLAGILIRYQLTALRASTPFVVEQTAAKFLKINTIYFSLSIATSLTTTFLIVLRIVLVQLAARATRRTPGVEGSNGQLAAKDFNFIIEILVESAMLYSVTLLTFVVFDLHKSANAIYAQNIQSQMAGLAPLLIILRIAAGQARPQKDWEGKLEMSSLKFAGAGNAQSNSEINFEPSSGRISQI